MSLPPHHQLPIGQGHIPEAWRYADATARAAATGLTADDLGRWALQLDDGTLWRLTDDSPVTWSAVGGGGGGGGGAVDSVNGQTGTVTLDADDISDSGTANQFATAAELTKLGGIEALADVTDATNVAAAGAVMEADTTTAAMGFVIDEDSFTSNLATKVPTQQSVKAYVDAAVIAGGSYTDEQAQDAAGSLLTDSTSIDFTYNDALNTLTAAVILEWLQDTVAAMLTGGSHTGITATYQDAGGVVDLAAAGGGGMVIPPHWVSGKWYDLWNTLPATNATDTSTTLSANVLAGTPFYVPANATIDRIAISVQSAGGAGSTARLGIYTCGADNLPGTLVIDGGTVAVDSTGTKTVTISQALTPGWYFAVAHTSATIIVAGFISNFNFYGHDAATSVMSAKFSARESRTYGALPASFTLTDFSSFAFYRVSVRVA